MGRYSAENISKYFIFNHTGYCQTDRFIFLFLDSTCIQVLPHHPVRAYCPHSTRILPEYRQNSAPVKIKGRLKTVFQAFRRPFAALKRLIGRLFPHIV